MTRICLDIVRRASGQVCNRDIVIAFMTARGMDTDDDWLVKLIAKRVGCCMRGQRDPGLVTGEDGAGADGGVALGKASRISFLRIQEAWFVPLVV